MLTEEEVERLKKVWKEDVVDNTYGSQKIREVKFFLEETFVTIYPQSQYIWNRLVFDGLVKYALEKFGWTPVPFGNVTILVQTPVRTGDYIYFYSSNFKYEEGSHLDYETGFGYASLFDSPLHALEYLNKYERN